jgi:ribosomal subunit interface protein
MPIPLEITVHNMDSSPAVEAAVREKAEKLERFAEKIMGCQVRIDAPHKHHNKGKLYHVSVEIQVPGKHIVVSRDPGQNHAHEDLYVAIRDAFRAAGRQLQEHTRVRRGKVKHHETPPHGRIAAIYADEDYGTIATADGREVYFHRNSLLNAKLEEIESGAEVRFDEEIGDKGPQASSVSLIGKHHLTS